MDFANAPIVKNQKDQNQNLENEKRILENEKRILENEKRKRINEKRRERRQRQKEEGGKSHAEEMKEYRDKNPEYTKIESEKRKALRRKRDVNSLKTHIQFSKRKQFNDFYDSLFTVFKDTFPSKVSIFLWEKLKKIEIDNVIKFGMTLNEIKKYRQKQLELLKQNPNHHCAGSIIFYIKTCVHRPKDIRGLTEAEKEWLKTFILENEETFPKYNYYEKKKDYYKEKSKISHEKTKLDRKTANLNLRFIKADPNRVLSIDEITNNPFCKNFSQREQHKIDLWKTDQNLDYLEKWRKLYEDYVMKVEKLSIEYKEDFLKINGRSNSSRDI